MRSGPDIAQTGMGPRRRPGIRGGQMKALTEQAHNLARVMEAGRTMSVAVELSPLELWALDDWIVRHPEVRSSRGEAIRRLLRSALCEQPGR